MDPERASTGAPVPPAEQSVAESAGELALGGLLDASHLAAPDELPALVAEHASSLGVRSALAYLVDLQQTVLVPFVGSSGPAVEHRLGPLPIASTIAGRAFQQITVQTQPSVVPGEDTRVWVPLLDGTERLGVLAVSVDHASELEAADGVLARRLRRFAALVAELVTSKTLYGDTIVLARRRGQMGLAAEVQWGLLPPLTFACREVVVAAALEPAYEVAGDSVDYAVDVGVARLAVFDGMGHGLRSAQLASLTVAAYRNARRNQRTLSATAGLVDEAIDSIHAGEAFATGVIAELDLDTGVLSWVNAGHPEPLLMRQGRLVKSLQAPPAVPFGLGRSLSSLLNANGTNGSAGHEVSTERLEPGDRVLLYTDGITEARSPSGELFGAARLVDLLTRAHAADLPAPETLRRVVADLLEHQQHQIRDDATLLLVEWRSPNPDTLTPHPS